MLFVLKESWEKTYFVKKLQGKKQILMKDRWKLANYVRRHKENTWILLAMEEIQNLSKNHRKKHEFYQSTADKCMNFVKVTK